MREPPIASPPDSSATPGRSPEPASRAPATMVRPEHVAGAPTDAVWLNRNWLVVAERLDTSAAIGWRRVRRWGWAAAAATTVLVALIAGGASLAPRFTAGDDDAPSVLADATLESTDAPMHVALADGSRVRLAPMSRLVVKSDHAERVSLDLDRGEGRFDVTPDRDRRFEVRAHGVIIRVVGTAFDVATGNVAGERHVSVAVTHGVVEVRRADDPNGAVHRLTAGERWSASFPVPTVSSPSAARAPEGEADGRSDDGRAHEGVSPAASTTASVRAAGPSAKALFQRAMQLRRAGAYRQAAAALEQLLAAYPNDPRAGVAALELGRLRADSLGDDEGAMEAFDEAASKQGGLRADALARRVAALQRRGDLPGCRRARAEYLTSFPQGVHAGVVRASCQEEKPGDETR
ncbi:MAG: FecR family protein [Myxococcota bacterium]